MSAFGTLLLICGLIGLIGGAVGMAAPALSDRFPPSDHDLADIDALAAQGRHDSRFPAGTSPADWRCVGDPGADALAQRLGEDGQHAGPICYCANGAEQPFWFSFARTAATWRIYVDAQPSYRGRSDDLHSTHRLRDDGRYYVCWTGQLPTLADAIEIATRWADNTQTYIETGARF